MPSSNTTQVLEFLNMLICCLDASGAFADSHRQKRVKEKTRIYFFNNLLAVNPVTGLLKAEFRIILFWSFVDIKIIFFNSKNVT
jgi:hypothetical protein